MRILVTAVVLAVAGCGSGGGGDASDAAEETSDPVDDGDDDAVPDPADEVECTVDGDCDDSDPCTTDSCDMDYGTCEHGPVDGDGDGFGPEECGGTDCNDGDEDVFPGSAVRRCDEDADCNGHLDADNDADGSDSEGCGGDDCNDDDETFHPGASPGCGMDPEDPADDLDCNGLPDADNDGDTFVNDECLGGNDCDDTSPLVNPEQSEVCLDGVDQDCDGETDGPILRIEDALIGTGDLPSVDWVGDQMAITWTSTAGTTDDLIYHLVPLSGIPSGRSRIITTGTVRKHGTVAWTGSVAGISWEDDTYMNPGVHFTLYEGGGWPPAVHEVRMNDYTSSATWTHMEWSGSRFGLVWADNRNPGTGIEYEIYMALIDSTGTKIGSDIRVSESPEHPLAPSVAWSGSEWGISWQDNRDGQTEIYFARVSASGVKVGTDVRVTNATGQSTDPTLAWTGSEYGVAWADHRDGHFEIYFTNISPAGVPVGTDVRVTSTTTDSDKPDMLWTGSFFTLGWRDIRDANHEIYMKRLAADGTSMDADVRITDEIGASQHLDTTWTGSELGLAWGDYRSSPASVLVAYVQFCE